jgi:hypothetical protein
LQSRRLARAAPSYDRGLHDEEAKAMRKLWWLAALVGTIVLAGCHNGGHAQNSTDMRAVNAVIDSDPLDVVVAGDTRFTGLTYGSTSQFAEFSAGSQEVTVRSTPTQAILFDKTLGFNEGANTTLFIYGSRTSMTAQLLNDDITSPDTPPASGNFKIRALGASADSGPVDLYVTPSSDISNAGAAVSAVSLSAVSSYAELPAGTDVLTFTIAGTKDVLFQSAPMALAAGNAYAVAVLPSGGGKLANALLLVQGTNGSGTLLSNPSGRIKAVNAVPDSSQFNFLADGATLLSSVPFGGASSYVPLASGTRTLQLEPSNVPGSIAASAPLQVAAGRDYTVAAVNTLSDVQLVAFTDDNTLPAAGFAKVRFANALVGSTGTDVLVNFAAQASGLAYKGASSYYTFAPATNYTITFDTPGGVSVIATLTPVELDAGGVYTAWLVGTASAPRILLVRDR